MELIVLGIGCFVAGVSSGLLGIGGGVLLVPLFHLWYGMSMGKAVGTSIAFIMLTAGVGVLMHGAYRNIDYRMVATGVVFSAVGAVLGAYLTSVLNGILIRKVFAVLLILIAFKMFFSTKS